MKKIALHGGDFDLDEDMSEYLASTGQYGAPAAPIVGLSGWLSTTRGGTEIHANLLGAMAQRSAAPTRYFKKLEGGDILTYLAPSLNDVIWKGVRLGSAGSPDYESWTPFKVVAYL